MKIRNISRIKIGKNWYGLACNPYIPGLIEVRGDAMAKGDPVPSPVKEMYSK